MSCDISAECINVCSEVKCTWYVDMYQPLCSEQNVLKLEGFADVYIALCDVYYLGNLLGT